MISSPFRIGCVFFAALWIFPGAAAALDLSGGEIRGGVKLGYSVGQAGVGWPQLWKNPFLNENRGGFYVEQARLRARLPIDSSLRLTTQFNFALWELSEIYFEAQWGRTRWKLGKFDGAGLRTGPATDEFSRTAIWEPRYARIWAAYKRLLNWRDYGIQAERDHFSGRFTHRLFLHNANWQNVINEEPNDFQAGIPATQALGMDYGWEWKTTEQSLLGGHLGALADKEWNEFFGHRQFWRANHWMRSNPIVDASVFHEFESGRAWFQSEIVLMSNRTILNPDSAAMKTWGASLLGRYRLGLSWTPYMRYELFDFTDGVVPNDILHLFTGGVRWSPSRGKRPWFWTFQFTHILEEDLVNAYGNDVLYAQLQAEF